MHEVIPQASEMLSVPDREPPIQLVPWCGLALSQGSESVILAVKVPE